MLSGSTVLTVWWAEMHAKGCSSTVAEACVSVVQIVKGDLTKQQVTAFVNPTNCHLSLSRQVSSHCASAVGPAFQQICDDYLESPPDGHTTLAEGSSAVAPAGAGGLLCQDNILAAGPTYGSEPLPGIPVYSILLVYALRIRVLAIACTTLPLVTLACKHLLLCNMTILNPQYSRYLLYAPDKLGSAMQPLMLCNKTQ